LPRSFFGRQGFYGNIPSVPIDTILLGVVGHPTASYLMVLQGHVDSPPKVLVSNRLDRAEVFPTKVIVSPFSQPILESPSHVAIGGYQGDFARLIESLKTTYDGHEGYAVWMEDFFVVPSFDLVTRFDIFKDEAPATRIVFGKAKAWAGISLAKQQIVWLDGCDHASFGLECYKQYKNRSDIESLRDDIVREWTSKVKLCGLLKINRHQFDCDDWLYCNRKIGNAS
jgi:hypothetical protein